MKANIKKGKSWEVETPAEYEKNGHKRSNKKISKMSKEFKRYQNKKVRQENFMNDENKGKTEKEMALEELSKGLEEIFETFIQDTTEYLKDFEMPDSVSPDEAVEVTEKTMDKCLKKFQESLG
jgi:hypothetical protein